jgi:hypothetical protein
MQKDACLGVPVTALYDGSPLAEKALAVAATLARSEEGELSVIIVDSVKEVQELRDQARAQLRDIGMRAQYRLLTRTTVDKLVQLMDMEDCGTLVLPARSALLEEEALLAFLGRVDVPTLFVR